MANITEDYRQIIEDEAREYVSELLKQGFSEDRMGLIQASFKGGYKKCLQDFAVPELIDALIETQVHLQTIIKLKIVLGMMKDV